MKVSIRRFDKDDIPNKVKWVNDPRNNTFLHYDLPLEICKTEVWFQNNMGRTDRYDPDECLVPTYLYINVC